MIFVLGASGLLGSVLCSDLKLRKKKFIGFSRFKKKFQKINFFNKTEMIEILKKNSPDIVINCSGLVNVDECNKDLQKAILGNCIIVKNFIDCLELIKKKPYFIQVSTDQIYNSKKINNLNKEIDENLSNNYSFSKFFGEKVLSNYKNSLILRTNFFGKSYSVYKKSFTDLIIYSIKKKEIIKLPNNVIFNPVEIKFLSEVILKACELKIKGIFNVGSRDCISKYDFALKVADKFKLDKKYILKYKSKYKINKRPLGTYMCTKKISKFIKVPTINESIKNMEV